MIHCIHMRTVGATENEKTFQGWGCGGGKGKGTPCFIHASQWEGMKASMPVRDGGEVVQEWKEGPLWTVPLLIEMYPTQANPTLGWIRGANTPFSLRGAPARVKSLLGSSVWGDELDVPLDAV